jgi:hypothetical protein
MMRDLETLAKHCKGEISLDINSHRDEYQTVEEYLRRQSEWCDTSHLSELIRQRMIGLDTVWELQFYPDSPIGSHLVFGTNLHECLLEAGRVLRFCEVCLGTGEEVELYDTHGPDGWIVTCSDCNGTGIQLAPGIPKIEQKRLRDL